MAEPKPQDEHRDRDERASEKWERFKDFTKKIAQVPKEEVDEKRKQEREKKRAG